MKKIIYKIFTDGIGTNNSADRDAWLIEKINNIPSGKKILDAGAGEARLKKYCSHLEYTAQEIALYDGVGNSKGYQKNERNYSDIDIFSDIYKIPVKDNFFDVILCVEVIEHLTDPIKAINELKRILKVGGQLIITAPFNSLTHYAPYHFYTGFTEYFYKHHLAELELEIIEIKKNGNYFEHLAQEILRVDQIAISYNNKNLGFLFKIIKLFFLRLLNKMSSKDNDSNELQCYGINVVCIKNSQ